MENIFDSLGTQTLDAFTQAVMGLDLNGVYGQAKDTPLNQAIEVHRGDIALWLIMNGAGISTRGRLGYTPLHTACLHGEKTIVKTLLRHGADMVAVDDIGQTPLHKAVVAGHTAIVDTLLANGADVNAPDIVGRTPLYSLFQNQVLAKRLLEAGAQLEIEQVAA